MYDYHMHTHYSSDCNTPMEEMIIGSINNGLREICFTDHCDLYHPNDDDFDFDYEKAYSEYLSLSEKYKDKISIKFGIEVGLIEEGIKETREIVDSNPFDFVLCSFHCLAGDDLYYKNLLSKYSPIDGMKAYFNYIYDMISKFQDFDVIGHLDLPSRYYKEIAALDLTEYIEELDKVLLKVIGLDKGIEINTSGFRYSNNNPYPNYEIIKRYFELGGKIVTLGGDAHTSDNPGKYFNQVMDYLLSIGVSNIYRYESRKPIPVSIEN